jgi:outer membrane protein assembly factor BamB
MIVFLAGIFCPLLVETPKDNSNENRVVAESSNNAVGKNWSSSLARAQTESVDWWPMFHHDLTHTGYSTSTAPNTNQTLWSYTTGDCVLSSPAVAGGMVFVGSNDNKVYALSAATGTEVWNYTTGGSVGWSSPAVAGGVVYVGSYDYKVYALDAATGAQVWNYTTGSCVVSSPAVAGGVVYVGLR